MPLTNAQVKQAISDSVLDNRCFSIYLFLEELITRPNAVSSDTLYRIYDANNNPVTTVESLLTSIDDSTLVMGYDFMDTFCTDRVHTFEVIVTNLTINFNYSIDDNKWTGKYGMSKYLRFCMTYLNDGATDSVPIKVVDIALTNRA
jgi:hypothetical protein